ncbi:phospholipid phosphatase [Bacteroidia bacterium]|nr:phospholipid phosphatase [Bacteroidia bacterium]
MRIKFFALFVLCFLLYSTVFADDLSVDTLTVKPNYTRFIFPSALISYGIATRLISGLQDFDHNLQDDIQKHVSRKYIFDDYLRFAPYVGIYAFDWMGVKAKNNFRDRTIVTATSLLLTTGLTYAGKSTLLVRRPDDSESNSFPSGHTSTAFTGAHILFHEYRDYPWIYIAGYAAATITGGMRMVNNRHWFSDVITGAGVGILSVEASYLLLPPIQRFFGIKNETKSLTAVPVVGNKYWGIGVAYVF